ncbi:MAG: c-type cytochrome, partial [Planctomycetaceae bacterium]|nr:c-type cytochrome [Planctomycetaceae bacterium]
MYRPFLILTCCVTVSFAQDHSHHHHDAEPIERPKVLLDKSERIVEYQLKRLDNARLLLVETATDDPKYLPVFKAILLRSGLSRQNREEALAGMTAINKTDVPTELLQAMQALDSNDRDQLRVGRQLAEILLSQSASALKVHADSLQQAISSENELLKSTGLAGLIVLGDSQKAWQIARSSDALLMAWLNAVALVPEGPARRQLYDQVAELTTSDYSYDIRRSAIRALVETGAEPAKSFRRISEMVTEKELRMAAVRSLLQISEQDRDKAAAAAVVQALVANAEVTPAAQRTTTEFLDGVQLTDELLKLLPTGQAKSYRERLRSVAVRVVRLRTVEEEMRYDQTFFTVEAGRPVQVILENEDLMPHNLVITSPGKLKDVALAGAELGNSPGAGGRMYVPDSPDVLFATPLVNAGQREILTFDAPAEPGEYPYVCTFPRHWMRMYGVMVVVPDLDAWHRNPVPPKDPLGNSRTFVRNWKLSDFNSTQLTEELRGRNPEAGATLFREATCFGCHKINGQGGAVGPELTDVLNRWK